MKKASKLLWVLLVMAAVMFFGCGGSSDDDDGPIVGNPKKMTTEWQVFYFKLVDSSRPEGFQNMAGLERIHFHNNGNNITKDTPYGLEIQKIFVSETMTPGKIPSGAKFIVDFTKDEANAYGTTFDGGNSVLSTGEGWIKTYGANGKASTGQRIDSTYKYLGDVNSSLFADPVYVGFVMRNVSETAQGYLTNLTFRGSALAASMDKTTRGFPFIKLFNLDYVDPNPPPGEEDDIETKYVNDWTTVYYQLPANLDGIHFKGTKGIVEIEKIFINDTDSDDGATILYDFTATPAYNASDFYWGGDIFDEYISDGKLLLQEDSDELEYFNAFCPKGANGKYIGFTIKCAATDYPDTKGLGDYQIVVATANPATETTVLFANMATSTGDFDLRNWMIAWLPIPVTTYTAASVEKGVDTINFHGSGTGTFGPTFTGPTRVEIQKVFINTTKTLTGAETLIDYTATPPFTVDTDGGNVYGVWVTGGTIVSVSLDSGHYVYEDTTTGWSFGGSFGTPLITELDEGDGVWVGFVVKTNTKGKSGLGTFRFEVTGGDTTAIQDLEIVAYP